eukprot:TRINITY_DN23544_c0_g1_i1.p1 TRINITY_DN23544_c0_g1~~TRINITY_DN23544_c0_g1_i1.p1  ORF type:complete len:546 (-),score=69.23 TRINITY_DN23544_c0_g1_i1:66-1703(-)
MEVVRTRFKQWDADNDGHISEEELKSVLVDIGVAANHASRLFQAADLDKDGKIVYEEFILWMFQGKAMASIERLAEKSRIPSEHLTYSNNCSNAALEEEVLDNGGGSIWGKKLGDKLVRGDAEVDVSIALEDKTIVALYFAAWWCPTCREVSHGLIDYYFDLAGKGLEIVLVSCDRDAEGMKEHTDNLPWLSLPFDESHQISGKLLAEYKVDGVPSMVLLNAKDGNLIDRPLWLEDRLPSLIDPNQDAYYLCSLLSTDVYSNQNLPWIPPTFEEALGETFVRGEEEVSCDVVRGKTLGLYFGARGESLLGFSSELKWWYNGLKEKLGDRFKIIHCSCDENETSMQAMYRDLIEDIEDPEGMILGLPWDRAKQLNDLLPLALTPPTLLIVNPDGTIINENGVEIVRSSAKAYSFPWKLGALPDLEMSPVEQFPTLIALLCYCMPKFKKKACKTLEPLAKQYHEAEEFPMFAAANDPGGQKLGFILRICGRQVWKYMANHEMPTLLLLNNQEECFFLGHMHSDGSGVQEMIDDWKNGKLEKHPLNYG